jgi:hypothetical protein
LHSKVQALDSHVAMAWGSVVVHVLPQVLQLVALVEMSTHELLQFVRPPSQPEAHW